MDDLDFYINYNLYFFVCFVEYLFYIMKMLSKKGFKKKFDKRFWGFINFIFVKENKMDVLNNIMLMFCIVICI